MGAPFIKLFGGGFLKGLRKTRPSFLKKRSKRLLSV
jgi:hypothetical protein